MRTKLALFRFFPIEEASWALTGYMLDACIIDLGYGSELKTATML